MKIIYIAVALLISSCQRIDYGYLNTDRRPYVIIQSKRFTTVPPWIPYKIVQDTLSREIGYQAYENVKPDTTFSTCSIDKQDSAFLIEIRTYLIVKP